MDWNVHSRSWPGFGAGCTMRVFQPPGPDCCSIMPKRGETLRVLARLNDVSRSRRERGASFAVSSPNAKFG